MRVSDSFRGVLRSAALTLILLPATLHAGTFTNPELIDTGYDPQSVASTDFNGDGIADIVYVNGTGPRALHVLLGRGNGKFTHGQDIDLPGTISGLTAINLADVTHDSVVDIVLAGSDGTTGKIVALAGKGDGTFRAPVISDISNANGDLSTLNTVMGIGDLNGDGAADIVVPSGNVYVLFGDNTGHFSLHSTLTFFLNNSLTYLYDINGDGHLDAVIDNLAGAQTVVLLGNGDGTFRPAVSYNLSYALLFADMDGDGHPDLVGELYPGQVLVEKGNADGTFGPPVTVATVPAAANLVATPDLNGDGVPDLVFTSPTGLGAALGQGNLTYGPMVPTVAGTVAGLFTYVELIASGDFNRDGHTDLAMGVFGGMLILSGSGDGTFVSADSYDVGHTVGASTIADLNGDDRPDIALTVSASYPRILMGDGAGKFTLATDQNQSYGTKDPASVIAAADFNGDSKQDLEIFLRTDAFPFGQPIVLFGAGNGTFGTPLPIATGVTLPADLNNDGRSDLLSRAPDANQIVAYLGQANGTFQTVTTAVTVPSGDVLAAGDVNHDGKADLLLFESPSPRLWLGKGDGTFTQSNVLDAVNVAATQIADLDGDGNGDVVIVPYPNPPFLPLPYLIFYSNGNGTFQAPVEFPVSHAYTQLVIADVNRDNKLDLVMSDGNGIAVVLNLGNRAFGNELHYVAGQKISGLSVADVNGDSYPDIVVANSGSTTAVVLLNNPSGDAGDGKPSSGAFTLSPEPSLYGQPVNLSLAMSVPSGPVPTGSVTFSVDGQFLATVNLSSGKATYKSNAPLNTGSHTFVGTYNGDGTYRAETFSAIHDVLPPVYPTTTVLTATPDVVYTSQTVSLVATVSSVVPVPAGVVTFMDGTETLGSRTIYGNPVLIFDTNLLSSGTHSLTAVYHGWQDPFNQQAVFQPSTSVPVSVVVNSTPTTTALTASSQSPTAGTVVTFTANVASNFGIPFGSATFYDGGVPLGTSSLKSDGTGTFSTASLAVGSHTITAAFNANATFGPSTSSSVTVTVSAAARNLIPTALTVSARSDGERSVLVASLWGADSDFAGEVVFLDGGVIVGTAPVDPSRTATLTVPAPGNGVHSFVASFRGRPQFAPAASPALAEQVPAGGDQFALSVGSRSIALTPSGSEDVLFSILPVSGFGQPVQLSCADGVPAGFACSFTPDRLYTGNSTLRIVPANKPGRMRAGLVYTSAGILCFSLFLFAGTQKRRKGAATVGFVLIGAGLLWMAGCGDPARSRLQTQMMVLTTRATAGNGDGTVVHSAQILVNVQNRQ